jgi:hypothetical protein
MGRQSPFLILFLAALVLAGHAQQDSPQRFRARVDLLTIDVAAVDAKGKPVEDLRPGDFTVKVDGKPRSIVSADLIRVDRTKERRCRVPSMPSSRLTCRRSTPATS